MTALTVRGVSVGYGTDPVLDHLDLEVPSGSLAAVLGASGSGKTTLLRVLAGFLTPTAGSVRLGDRVVTAANRDGERVFVPPERRRIGIVPQEGALFGHLDVAANVGFGLPRGSRARVEQMLELVGLREYARARPQDLSGGQQQRVALARALAPAPDVVLLDEPFSSLDAALRARLRTDVRDLLREVNATAVLVTHDQQEALCTADLLAVMRDGRIVQAGAPARVYSAPVDLGVARFIGDAVELPAVARGERAHCALGEVTVRPAVAAGRDCAVVLMLRPEQLAVRCDAGAVGPGAGVVRAAAYHGHDSLLTIDLADGTRLSARVGGGTAPPGPGQRVSVTVTGAGRVFEGPGGGS